MKQRPAALFLFEISSENPFSIRFSTTNMCDKWFNDTHIWNVNILFLEKEKIWHFSLKKKKKVKY